MEASSIDWSSVQPGCKKRSVVMKLSIKEAKQRLTIPDLWDILELDGTPGRSCRSPFREDANPSFSVYADGARWHDFGTDEGGDAIDFLASALNLCKTAACRQFLALAEREDCELAASTHNANSTAQRTERSRSLPKIPVDLHSGTTEELEELRQLRGLPSVQGLQQASKAGLLRFATVAKHSCWLVMDASCECIVARRLDGGQWEWADSKAHMLRGSRANHLIGGREAEGAGFVLFVEGTPDLLAAFEIIASGGMDAHEFRSVCMPSASGALNHEDCVHLKSAKLVWIIKHADDSGEHAARKWNNALHAHGVANVICDLRTGAKDLNDLVRQRHFSAPAFLAALRTATRPQWSRKS
jgi:hypothetical protein